MITTQSADNVLKSYYLTAVAEQLDKSANPLLARIRKTTSDVWGKDVRKVVRYGVAGGVAAGTETGLLPNMGDSHYATFVATLKNLYGAIEITDKAIRASANGNGGFVDLVNDQMEDLIRCSSLNFGRMLFGDGTGKLATITASEKDVYTVDSTRNLFEGMYVDVYTPKDLYTNNRVILEVDRLNKKVKLSGSPITMPEERQLILYVQHSKGIEITGLGALFSDSTTLYGVPRAGNSWLTPVKKTDVGEITEAKVQEAIDEVEERSGSKINFIVCSWGVRRAFAAALAPYRRMEAMQLEGGFTALSFNGIPVVADRFCPENTMYLLNTDDFSLHQLCDWQWMEGEDGKVLKQIANKAAYSATLVKYAELLCTRPAGQAQLTGITEA